MQFNSEASNQDLYSDCRFLCGISSSDTTTYPLADFTRNANYGLDRGLSIVLKADGMQPHDDTNNTGTEILDVTGNLVSGTGKYATSVTWLKRGRVRVKDRAGNWVTLVEVKRNELSDAQLVATGVPTTFHVLGNWVYPRPTPNYASTGGLEVQYQRGSSYFATTDTTKTPGFATQFHQLPSLYGAFIYCEVSDLEKRAAKIMKMIERMEMDMLDFYSSRDTESKVSLQLTRDDYGQSALGGERISNPDGF